MENPVVKKLSSMYQKTPAQILLRHILQRGMGAVPKSSNPTRLRQNFNIFDFSIDENSMKELDKLDLGTEGKIGNWEPWTW